MIITIEPGIYLENQFGFRHENTIHLSESGPIELTQYPN
jgi:Xaa-Pro aminopeptidase